MTKSIRLSAEPLEARALMSATLAAPTPEPTELRYELENALITSFQTSAHATGDRPMESLSINYTKITYNTAAGDGSVFVGVPGDDGMERGQMTAGYDLKAAKKV